VTFYKGLRLLVESSKTIFKRNTFSMVVWYYNSFTLFRNSQTIPESTTQ